MTDSRAALVAQGRYAAERARVEAILAEAGHD